MRQSIEDGEMFTRYHFAKLIATKEREALAQPPRPMQECPNYEDCKGACFQCEYFNAETGTVEYPPQRTEGRVCCQQYDICLEPCTSRGEHLKQRTWVGLASEDRLTAKYMQDAPDGIEAVIDYIEAKLKEKNT